MTSRDATTGRAVGALAEGFRQGDEQALRDVVEMYGVRLKAFSRTIVVSAELAEEVVQDAILTAWQHRLQLKDPRRLESWLFTITRRVALRRVQKASHRLEVAVEPAAIAEMGLPDSSADGRQRRQAEEAAKLLQEALQSLEPKRREILSLRYFSDLSLAEIAEVLDIPLGSVGTTMSRALASLKDYFERKGLKKDELIP